MTNDRKDADQPRGAGFMKEGGSGREGESAHRGQQGALGGSTSGDEQQQADLRGNRDVASGRRNNDNLATQGESDVQDRKDTDIGSST
jgi:hypothetical protein